MVCFRINGLINQCFDITLHKHKDTAAMILSFQETDHYITSGLFSPRWSNALVLLR